ncbi:MAG: carboxypeptidase regulatory-like domain-containing protein [bacterium]
MNRFKHFYTIFLPAVLALLLITYACQENLTTPDVNTNEIAGQILDEQDLAVPGAIIQVFSGGSGVLGLIDKDTTDEDGFFRLSGIPEKLDNLKMRIDHDDFTPFEIPLTEAVQGKDNKKIGVKLQHDTTCTGILEVIVKNINDEPIQNVEIRLNRGDKIIRKAFSKENGTFVFEHVCAGEYWLRLAKDGYKVIEQEFAIEDGESKSIDFEMLFSEDDSCCAGIINFTVLDSLDGSPVENVKARLWKGDSKIREFFTDSDGKVTFERICDGEYQISYFKEGYYGEEFNFTMGCSDTLNITKQILKKTNSDSCCNGVVNIFVKDSATNAAIPNVLAKLWKDGKIAGDGRTSESGLVTFSNLCEGKYGFSLHHEQYGAREFNLELGCNETVEIHRTMLKSLEDSCCDGQIEITVKDKETKELINNALGKLWKNGKILKEKKSENGIIKFTDLCMGEYFIDIIHEKYGSIEFEVKVECNQKVNLTKELELNGQQDSCCNGVVIVAPKDKDSGELIRGSVVKLWFGGKIVFQETVHESALIITKLCAGKYQFSFLAEGYISAEEDFTLECNDTLEFPFYMQRIDKDTCCHGRLVVIPKDSLTGEVLNGAKVKLWRDGKIVKEGTVEGGQVIFDGLCLGNYGVDILKDGYKAIEFQLDMKCNDNQTITRNLLKLEDIPCCNGRLTVRIQDSENGLNIKGAVIKLMKDGKIVSQKTQEGDAVVFEKLCEGNYRIVAVAEGYEGIEFDVEMGCDDIKNIEKSLKKKNNDCCKGNLHIIVRDSTSNNPIAGITVKLWQGDSKKALGTTTDGGVCKLINICEGEYYLTLEGTHHNKREIPIAVGCNDTLELQYKMMAKEGQDTCNTAELYLLVKDAETYEHLGGAQVRIYDMENNLIAEGTTNEEGYYSKTNLIAPKKYKIVSWREDYKENSTTVEYGKCEKKEAVLKLQKKE